MRPVKLAGTGVGGSILDGARQILQSDVADRHRGWIGFDPHSRLRPVNRDLAHAGQNTKALADLRIGIVVELAFRDGVADQRNVLDRLVIRIRLGKCGSARQIDRKLCLGASDGRLHIGRRAVEALGEIKLKNKTGVALTIVRGHQFKTRDLHELALEWRGHIVGHRSRSCSRIVDLDLDNRIIDGRQIAYRQPKICQHSKQYDGDGQRDRHYRTTNENF